MFIVGATCIAKCGTTVVTDAPSDPETRRSELRQPTRSTGPASCGWPGLTIGLLLVGLVLGHGSAQHETFRSSHGLHMG
jgi:hypothetical protein